ncbi:MAG: hypothetical protein ACJA0M_000112 [Chitinophagales bacterium]|jgi:hypothetical protein
MLDNTIFGFLIIAVMFALSLITGVVAASERDINIDIPRQLIERSVNGKVLSMEQIKSNKMVVSHRFTMLTDSGVIRIFTVNQIGEVIKEA